MNQEHNEQKYRNQEVEQTAQALRREGKIDKDTYDWFTKSYKKKIEQEVQKQKHESLSSIGVLGAS